MSRNLRDKVAHQRLSVLQLAEALGNVSGACRQRGMTRTQFYDYKRHFELQGLEGLKGLPPIHKSHPQTTPPEVAERILTLSPAHPAWGCVRLSERLKLDGASVSSPTIQHILIKHGMASKFDRLLKLQEQVATEAIELSPEQSGQIEKADPCFWERRIESSRARRALGAGPLLRVGGGAPGRSEPLVELLQLTPSALTWAIATWASAHSTPSAPI